MTLRVTCTKEFILANTVSVHARVVGCAKTVVVAWCAVVFEDRSALSCGRNAHTRFLTVVLCYADSSQVGVSNAMTNSITETHVAKIVQIALKIRRTVLGNTITVDTCVRGDTFGDLWTRGGLCVANSIDGTGSSLFAEIIRGAASIDVHWCSDAMRTAVDRCACIIHAICVLGANNVGAIAKTRVTNVAQCAIVVIITHIAVEWREHTTSIWVTTVFRAFVTIVAVQLEYRDTHTIANAIFFTVAGVSIRTSCAHSTGNIPTYTVGTHRFLTGFHRTIRVDKARGCIAHIDALTACVGVAAILGVWVTIVAGNRKPSRIANAVHPAEVANRTHVSIVTIVEIERHADASVLRIAYVLDTLVWLVKSRAIENSRGNTIAGKTVFLTVTHVIVESTACVIDDWCQGTTQCLLFTR